MSVKTKLTHKMALVSASILAVIILLELGMRTGGFALAYVQERRNKIALRQQGAFRIMCIGESTTADIEGCYPKQLQEILNQADIGIRFSVINKGIGGVTTTTLVSKLEQNLEICKPDMVVVMMGTNDNRNDIVRREPEDRQSPLPFFKRLKVYKLAKLLLAHFKATTKTLKNVEKETDINKVQDGYSAQKEDNKNLFAYTEPNNPQSYFELARYHQIRGDLTQAEAYFKMSIDAMPSQEAYMGLGWVYAAQGREEEAEAIMKRAIDLYPENVGVYLDIGTFFITRKKYYQAESLLEKAVLLSPTSQEGYIRLAQAYSLQGRQQEAAELLKQAVVIRPENDIAYGLLYNCYLQEGKQGPAEESAAEANKLRITHYNPRTQRNYQKLKYILKAANIPLVCVQYPVRSVASLKNLLYPHNDIIFVDNEMVFKTALAQGKLSDYFTDMFAGDFGHCTPKGNRILAKNIADTILKEYFDYR